QRSPKSAGGIGVNFQRQRFEFLTKPGTRLDPGFRERDTLGAVFISREPAKFCEFGNRAFWIQGHVTKRESLSEVNWELCLRPSPGHAIAGSGQILQPGHM